MSADSAMKCTPAKTTYDASGRAAASLGGTLTAVGAAAAIADGWRRTAPSAHLDLAPLSDGGPGFIDVLHAAGGGELHSAEVRGPLGRQVRAEWLLARDTAYIESAQACGLHLVPESVRNPLAASTY